MDFFEILKTIMLPNKDNGYIFKNTERIEKINRMLWDSKYKRVNSSGLFFLFSVKPLESITNPVLISSHIDCVKQMTEFFTKDYSENLILGTFDNCITNAAILFLMLSEKLMDNVIVAFTGDEEYSCTGAKQLVEYLSEKGKTPVATIVLDVTDMGWESNSSFTIENNFWKKDLGERVINVAKRISSEWKFVPSDVYDVPEYVDRQYLIDEEALEDESWEYDNWDWECFSFCLPTKGPMHSNEGVLARKTGCIRYIEALGNIVNDIAGNQFNQKSEL